MKRIHKMLLPQKVIVGEKIIEKICELHEELAEKKRIVVITGPNVYNKLKCKIRENWKDGQEIRVVFANKATIDEVRRITEIIKGFKGEIILALGGGRVIDLAKVAAFNIGLDFISVPTAASHDGIASLLASIKGGGRVFSYITKPPKVIIVDIDVICDAPKRLTSSGVGDAVAKITAVRDWKLAHERTGEYYGEYAAQLALMSAELVIRKAKGIGSGNKESIRTLVEALISDGVAAGIAGSSRPCSGSEHLFSHALDAYSTEHALHGEQCGVGTIMMAYLHGLDYHKIKTALKAASAPVNAKELKISPKNILIALRKAPQIRPNRYTILNEFNMTEEFALKIARETEVID